MHVEASVAEKRPGAHSLHTFESRNLPGGHVRHVPEEANPDALPHVLYSPVLHPRVGHGKQLEAAACCTYWFAGQEVQVALLTAGLY